MRVSCVVAVSALALGVLPGQVLADGQEAQEALLEGATIAWINVPQIAAESASGQESAARVQALNEEKLADLNKINEAMQASQEKLQQGGTVMSDAARAQLEREIGRMQVDIQRATEDAQIEVQSLHEELQATFQDDLFPVIAEVATEKGLQLVLSITDSGVVWTAPGLDITADVIIRFDAAHAASGGAQPQP